MAEAVQGAVARLTVHQAEAGARRAAITAELATIATRERKLLDALVGDAGGVPSPSRAVYATSWRGGMRWRPSW